MYVQVKYSPRRIPGAGLVDGEACERLWSYLRPFGPMTKEMTPGNRRDLLTHALAHYAERQTFKLGLYHVYFFEQLFNVICRYPSNFEKAFCTL